MAQLTTRPDKFAAEVNAKVPGACRQVTADDVRDMVACGLIGKFDCFLDLDLETVRAILQYEKLRKDRQKRDEIKDDDGGIHCRRCGVVLARPKVKRGRPHEYCPVCEPLRGRGRYQKWRRKMQVSIN